jgi:GWxTD domain-containing protein
MNRIIYHICIVCIAVTSAWITSCARTTDPLIERGEELYYRPGYPEVRLAVFGFLDENNEGMFRLTADVTSSSLIFKEIDGEQVAEILIEIRMDGIEGTFYSDTYTARKQIKSEDTAAIRLPENVQIRREMKMPPGNYRITLSIVDESSGRSTSRASNVYIPDPASDTVSISAVQLLALHPEREWEGFVPITAGHVTSVKDSLRFNVQVTNMQPNFPITVRSRLIRFEADSTAARPMSAPRYSASSLPYKGIDYRDITVFDQTSRVIEDTGSVMIEFRQKRPDRGNYRFEVHVEGPGVQGTLYRARDFSVKGENFPYIRNARELAEPLVYLMSDREYRELMSIEDPAALKEAIDYFWLSNIGSVDRAQHVISLYYDRVEQANKQFSNFKEGWKTDAGMVYILFGPPWYVTTRLNQMQWSYSYNREDPDRNYMFERSRIQGEHFPFNNYLLLRRQGYYNIQYQQIQRWKTGMILQIL